MKSIYEIFDEFEMVSSKKDRMAVIEKNLSTTLVQVLELAFHPNNEWLITEMPDGYEVPTDVLPDFLEHNYQLNYVNCICFKKDILMQKS